MPSKTKKRKLDPCEYCYAFLDGTEKLVTVYRHQRSSHFIFEHVQYFTAKVVKEMDRLMQEQPSHFPTVSVPVIEFPIAA